MYERERESPKAMTMTKCCLLFVKKHRFVIVCLIFKKLHKLMLPTNNIKRLYSMHRMQPDTPPNIKLNFVKSYINMIIWEDQCERMLDPDGS